MNRIFAGAISACLLLAAAAFVQGADPAPPSARPPCKKPFDPGDLAQRNEAPRLVVVKRRNQRYAQYPPAYDWSEQRRVLNVLRCAIDDAAGDEWDSLLKGLDDHRYALTTVADDDDLDQYVMAYNETVGDLCAMLARRRLEHVVRRHLPKVPDPRDERFDLEIGIETEEEVAAWLKQRPGKALYELQMDVCKDAIEALDQPKRLIAPEELLPALREHLRKALTADIETLKRTKKSFECPGWQRTAQVLGARDAKEIEERLAEK